MKRSLGVGFAMMLMACDGSGQVGGPCVYHPEDEVVLVAEAVGEGHFIGGVSGPEGTRLLQQFSTEASFEVKHPPDVHIEVGQTVRATARVIERGSCVPVQFTFVAVRSSPSDFLALFEEVTELTQLQAPMHSAETHIPFDLAQERLGVRTSPEAADFVTFVPAYRASAGEFGDLLLFIVRDGVADRWHTQWLRDGEPVADPVNLAWPDLGYEVDSGEPFVENSAAYLSPRNSMVFVLEHMVYPRDDVRMEAFPIVLEVRAFGPDESGRMGPVELRDFAVERILDVIYARMDADVARLQAEGRSFMFRLDLRGLLADAVWALRHDVTGEGVESWLAPLVALNPAAIEEVIETFSEADRGLLRAVVGG